MEHVKAVIFDWAGTVVDYGSLAPMGAFVETFAEFGVEISIEEARGPMGMAKRPHIASLAAMPRIAEAWTRKHGRAPTDGDIDALYDVFVPKSVAVAAHYADVIPGAAEVVSALRAEGVQIGSSTGYTREIMAKIAPRAAEQGFQPDSLVCAGDTPEGRPSPLIVYKGLIDLDVWPAWHAIKVDGTTVGVVEGVNAGAWGGRRRRQRQCVRPVARRRDRPVAGRVHASPRAGAGRPLRRRRALRDRFRGRPPARRRPDRGTPRPRRAGVSPHFASALRRNEAFATPLKSRSGRAFQAP